MQYALSTVNILIREAQYFYSFDVYLWVLPVD